MGWFGGFCIFVCVECARRTIGSFTKPSTSRDKQQLKRSLCIKQKITNKQKGLGLNKTETTLKQTKTIHTLGTQGFLRLEHNLKYIYKKYNGKSLLIVAHAHASCDRNACATAHDGVNVQNEENNPDRGTVVIPDHHRLHHRQRHLLRRRHHQTHSPAT